MLSYEGISVVARDGIEPPTPAFSGLRSTDGSAHSRFRCENLALSSSSVARACLINSRLRIRSARATCEREPRRVLARRIRSIPAGVLGPVLRPPCNRHRPFGIAGHLQALFPLVFAPHRGTLRRSPRLLPFRRPSIVLLSSFIGFVRFLFLPQAAPPRQRWPGRRR